MPKQLALLITNAAALREASYDQVASTKWYLANPDPGNCPPNFYRLSLRDACTEACESCPNFTEVVFLLLYTSWNDALDWATAIHLPETTGV